MRQSVYDLHCHSSYSDGQLTPEQLVRRAAAHGVTHLAVTDHDTVAGLDEASASARAQQVSLITGVEISVTWERKNIHLVGLDFDPEYPPLIELLRSLQSRRLERAEKIASKLARRGVESPLEQAMQLATGPLVSRVHFAHVLVAQGFANSFADAFKYYLGQGKPAYVTTNWATMAEAVNAIVAAGGLMVIAHPRRYRLSHSWMRRLLKEFRQAGGCGIEVITGSRRNGDTESATALALRYGLLGSIGSDFHTPENGWVELGRLASLPAELQPVWTQFNAG